MRSSFEEQLPSLHSDLRSDPIPEGQVRSTACKGRHISRNYVSSPTPPHAPSCRPCESSNERALLLLQLLLPPLPPPLLMPLLKLSVKARRSKTVELKLSGSRRLSKIGKLLPPLLLLLLKLKLSVNARRSKTAELKLSGSRRLSKIAKLPPPSRCARVARASSYESLAPTHQLSTVSR